MNKRDILELKRRFKKEQCTFTRVAGCFVNSEKNIILRLNETFLNLDDDDYFKYLEIAKKVLSGTPGNNILELNFSLDMEESHNKQLSFIELKKSKLKDEEQLEKFYKSIIDNYHYTGNYLILIFHDVYDIITKTSDNLKIDESEEVFEYILCAICPVELSAPSLCYYEGENMIKSRMRDWIVGSPTNGFMYPAFIDRSADLDFIMYYTKNSKDIHPELMEGGLGCISKETYPLQRETFQYIVKDFASEDEEEADKLYAEIQENLNNIIENHESMNEGIASEPIKLTTKELKNVLMGSGITEEKATKIEQFYTDNFDGDLPVIEGLIDSKVSKENEQRKKERELEKQVEFLKDKLEKIETSHDVDKDYDIILKIKSEKIDKVKSEVIDGQEYMLIPIDKNEKTKIDELEKRFLS